MATRHERRKAKQVRDLAATRKLIVQSNLSNPTEQVSVRGSQISQVYANRMDRARGRGTTAMFKDNTARIVSRVSNPSSFNFGA